MLLSFSYERSSSNKSTSPVTAVIASIATTTVVNINSIVYRVLSCLLT